MVVLKGSSGGCSLDQCRYFDSTAQRVAHRYEGFKPLAIVRCEFVPYGRRVVVNLLVCVCDISDEIFSSTSGFSHLEI